jgi:hypothetical protein
VHGAAALFKWETLRRWARAVKRRALFYASPDTDAEVSLRGVAARAATALMGYAAPETRALPDEHRAFFGALTAGW